MAALQCEPGGISQSWLLRKQRMGLFTALSLKTTVGVQREGENAEARQTISLYLP